MDNTFACPNCGAEVRVGSPSCPGCGSDDKTGWSEDTLYDGLDLPEPYDEYSSFRQKKKTNHVFTTIVAVLLLLLFLLGYIF
tara:strand:- start:552 stop:797 length:246 start_codon:yes stop_codon:yes gene_type:complete